MRYTKHQSGLLVPSEGSKFSCKYELDERVDRDLANLTQKIYRAIQSFLGDRVDITVGNHQGIMREAFPDAVQAWTIYCAVLIHGSADSALTLVLHNLGREANILARQIFEYSAKAQYFKAHPREAKRELEAEPFREMYLLEDLGYDKRARRYKEIKQLCSELAKKRPALASYAKKTRRSVPPTTMETLGRKSKKVGRTYALHYRVPSRTVHATVLGMRDIVTSQGIVFDGREKNPDYILVSISHYVLLFLRILDSVFNLNKASEISQLSLELKPLEKIAMKRMRDAY